MVAVACLLMDIPLIKSGQRLTPGWPYVGRSIMPLYGTIVSFLDFDA
jgi:hypothetical protein